MNRIRGWFGWLCAMFPTDNPPKLEILPDEYDSIAADGQLAFGCFNIQTNTIHVVSRFADLSPDDEEHALFTTLAHEYGHHLQFMNAQPLSEEDADDFALKAYDKWSQSISRERVSGLDSCK